MQLDHQFVAHRCGPGRGRGESVKVLAPGVGEREDPLVGPTTLTHQACLDQSVGLQAVELAIQLCGAADQKLATDTSKRFASWYPDASSSRRAASTA